MIIKKVKLEFVENTSKKFYVIHIVRETFTGPCQVYAIFGRIGCKGTLSNKGTFSTYREAETLYLDLLKSKEKKGYQIVADSLHSVIPAAPKTIIKLTKSEKTLFSKETNQILN